MDPILLISLAAVGVLAGVIGTLFGVGGGIIFIPILTILYGLTTTEAAAVSLIGIIVTSASGAAFFIKNDVSNIRLGLFLEISTTIGAIAGAFLALYTKDWILMLLFAAVMLLSAFRMIRGRDRKTTDSDDAPEFHYHDLKEDRNIGYDVCNKKKGFALCSVAGMLSSMTGVGGGVVKVPIMNSYMGIPIKAATATSTYMVGITAFSGAIIYFLNGQVLLDVAAFVAIGAFLGSAIGTYTSKFIDGRALKKYFGILLIGVAILMILQAGGIL